MRLLFWGLMPFLAVTLLIGGAVLWSRTKRIPALIQVIACGLVLGLAALEELAKYVDRHQRPSLQNFLNVPLVQFIAEVVIIICFVSFPAAYVWHAFTAKRI